MNKRLILIEDEFAIALDLKLQLAPLGYDILEIGNSFSQAIQLVAEHEPECVIMDIHIDGDETGIDAAKIIQDTFEIPVVFLTAHSDDLTFETALGIKPYGYVLKPFNVLEIKHSIELAITNHKTVQKQRLELMLLKNGLQRFENIITENEAIFIKDNGQLTRVFVKDIIRLEAMDNYTLVYTEKTRHIVGQFLKDVHECLPAHQFVRVHRSHVVNHSKIQTIDGNLLFIQNVGVPISKGYRSELMLCVKVI